MEGKTTSADSTKLPQIPDQTLEITIPAMITFIKFALTVEEIYTNACNFSSQ